MNKYEQMDNVQSIKPGTPEMEMLLQSGYPFSVDEAKRIIKEREANPASVPYERYVQADAMVKAYTAKPIAIDKMPGWKRQKQA
jgi:hypothetical protein